MREHWKRPAATCCGCRRVERHLSRRASPPRQRRRRVGALGGERGQAISTASRRWSPSCCFRSARRRDVRRKGFPAARGDPADGRGPRHSGRDRRRADGARGGRPRAVVTQRLSVARTSARRPWRCRGARKRARRDPRRASRSPRAGNRRSRRCVDAGFLRIDYVALVDADDAGAARRPAGEMRLIAAAVDRIDPADRQSRRLNMVYSPLTISLPSGTNSPSTGSRGGRHGCH